MFNNLPVTSKLINGETDTATKQAMIDFVQLRLDRGTKTRTIPDANYPALFVEMGWAKEVYVDFFNSYEEKIVNLDFKPRF